MPYSVCHVMKMVKHEITGKYVCPKCGYCSEHIRKKKDAQEKHDNRAKQKQIF